MAVRSDSITNPALKKMSEFNRSIFGTDNAASYEGIAVKTIYFLIVFCLGMGAYFYIDNYYDGTNSVILSRILIGALLVGAVSGIAASFLPSACAVFGTLYSMCEGYTLTWMSMSLGQQYKGIIIEALALTVLIIGVMAFLYASKIVRATERLKSVLLTCLIVSLLGSFVYFLLGFFAPGSELYILITTLNFGPVGILIAVLGVALAALLLINDFDFIAQTVERGMGKEYEWYASYGLIVGVIYLYVKILRMLTLIYNRKNN